MFTRPKRNEGGNDLSQPWGMVFRSTGLLVFRSTGLLVYWSPPWLWFGCPAGFRECEMMERRRDGIQERWNADSPAAYRCPPAAYCGKTQMVRKDRKDGTPICLRRIAVLTHFAYKFPLPITNLPDRSEAKAGHKIRTGGRRRTRRTARREGIHASRSNCVHRRECGIHGECPSYA